MRLNKKRSERLRRLKTNVIMETTTTTVTAVAVEVTVTVVAITDATKGETATAAKST